MVENTPRTQGTVRIVGTGLLGTSIGLALRASGVHVVLEDSSPSQASLAAEYGAGIVDDGSAMPSIVIVATPPDSVAHIVARELKTYPNAIVTDVASIKKTPFDILCALEANIHRYVGGHPIAGREKGGPTAARSDLFQARPWVVCTHQGSSQEAISKIESLIIDLKAFPVIMSADEHDAAVATISHVPQLVSTLMAKRLLDAPNHHISLAGQGVRDLTRIAASSPEMWTQIFAFNAQAMVPIVRKMRDDFTRALEALENIDRHGSKKTLAEYIYDGNRGVAHIPGKHGQARRFASLVVAINDTPGQLAELLHHMGQLDINLEDLRLEHSPGARVGIVTIMVVPEVFSRALTGLSELGWKVSA